MSTDHVEPPNAPDPRRETGPVPNDPMIEGEEAPPAGVRIMAPIRWGLLVVSALVAIFMWWSYASAEFRGEPNATRAAATYHCPMHPQIVASEPGECPICHMSLEPIVSNRSGPAPAASAATNALGTTGATPPGTTPITLTLDRIQSIGVRTAVVGEGNATQTLRVTAVVAPTEQGVAEVHVRSPGFVERLFVNQTGVAVARLQPLFVVYSPEIFQAESELLAAQRWEGPGAAGTSAAAARRKLELLGMAAKDIDEVLKTREPMRAVPVYAPQAGYVTKKNLVAGSYVTPEMMLYEIQDLSRVYVIADVFQQDIAFLHKGTVGRFVPTRRPDQVIDARVDLLYPTLNAEARTTRVRMQVKIPTGVTIRPGEYGSVEFATPARKALTVPRDAVVDTGLHTYVFVVHGEGTFSPREVVLGGDQGDQATILSGLSPGDRVVSGATFLIDSESRLQASAAQAATSAPASPVKKP
jgi:Cu(I)/Ag(I) efflux system membrane fusion protein